MKTNYIFLFIIIFSAIEIFPLMAQTPIYLGKTSEIAATYKAKAQAKKNNGKGDKIKIKYSVPGFGTIVLRMNDSGQEGADNTYSGYIEDLENSNFYLKVAADKLSGYIILKEKKKAYLYSSVNGSAYLQETNIDQIVCIEYLEGPEKSSTSSTQSGVLEAVTVPSMQSLPGATAVVLLDFNGQYVTSPRWNGGSPINAAPASLTQNEITEVWKIISEDYRPFAINITTSEAVYNSAPANRRMRVVFTPTKDWFGSAGGVAYVKSFTWGDNTPCWVFNSGIKGAGEAGSHEVGHTLGLQHDGRTSPLEGYFQGHNSWAPIMGLGYYREQVQWSKGEYSYADNLENDLSIITSQNGFGYRMDDHSNSSTNATPLKKDAAGNVAASSNKGIITTQRDIDVFSFQTSGGLVSLTVSPSPSYANLDVLLTLKNSSGSTVFVSNPTGISASINQSLPAGTYHIYIDGAKGALGANSDYNSMGSYTISGNIAPSNTKPTVNLTSPLANANFTAPASITINATAADANGTVSRVEFYRGTTKLGEDLKSPYSYTWSGVAAGSYSLTAKAFDNIGASTTSTAMSVTVSSGPVVSCSGTGSITREVWTNITGKTVSNIPVNTAPTTTGTLSSFQSPVNAGSNYGQRIRGYVCVGVSGSYTFYIASDDNSELYISPDRDPSKKIRIAYVNGWTNVQEWTKSTTQKSSAIALTAGVKYYIEALHKEDASGDHLEVGWQSSPTGAISVIPGANLSPFLKNTTARLEGENLSEETNAFLKVYPNPSSGENLEIELTGLLANQQVVLTLINNVGTQIIRQAEISDMRGTLFKELFLPIKLSSGVYILKATTANRVFYQKLIIAN